MGTTKKSWGRVGVEMNIQERVGSFGGVVERAPGENTPRCFFGVRVRAGTNGGGLLSGGS